MNYSNRGSAGSSFLKIIITFVSLAAVSLGAAFFWQQSEDSLIASAAVSDSSMDNSSTDSLSVSSASSEEQTASDSSVTSADDEYSDIEMSEDAFAKTAVSSSSEVSASSSDDEASASSQEGAKTPSHYARDAVAGSVSLSKSVGYDYFDDAIFFGDSISTGIPLYMQTMVPETAVVAAQGVSPGGALTAECINSGGSRITMLDAAKAKGERTKVYIMLGANALDYDEEPFIKGYTEFLRAVKAEYPEAVIYVQSMLPVTANVNNVYSSKNINNERISAYNAAICKMALAEGANYVDVAQGIVDENGFLPNEASPLDGMHLSAEYYLKWFDYLRNHTVSPKK